MVLIPYYRIAVKPIIIFSSLTCIMIIHIYQNRLIQICTSSKWKKNVGPIMDVRLASGYLYIVNWSVYSLQLRKLIVVLPENGRFLVVNTMERTMKCETYGDGLYSLYLCDWFNKKMVGIFGSPEFERDYCECRIWGTQSDSIKYSSKYVTINKLECFSYADRLKLQRFSKKVPAALVVTTIVPLPAKTWV